MESHGDLKSTYADLMENLSCPICQGRMKASRILACNHTYCLECVKKLAAINGLTPNIKCCHCHNKTSIPSTGFNDPTQNYRLKCLLEERAAITKKIEALFAEQASATSRQQQGTAKAKETMQIFVRVERFKSQLTCHTFNVRMSDTLDALKRQIEKDIGILSDLQGLYWAGRQLHSGSETLEEVGIRKECTLWLKLRLLGGDDTQ